MDVKTDVHGGNVYKARDCLNKSISEILDYSANINPLGVPQSFRIAVLEHLDLLQYYPDPEYVDARKSLGQYHNLDIANIIMGNGATEILFLIMETLRPGKVLIPSPSFAEYRSAAESVGSTIVDYRLEEENEFKLCVDEFLNCITSDIDMVVLCNPNNPTSQIINKEEMELIVSECSKKGIVVVLDEAFIDFVAEKPDLSMVDQLYKYPNLFIVRALTKFYAIPGLRLGYGLAGEELIKRLQQKKQPWTLNNFASLAAQILPWDYEYIRMSQDWIQVEKDRFYMQLADIGSIKVYKPYGNFMLIKLLDSNFNSMVICDKMQHEDILVRDASNFNNLNQQYIRIAIKDRTSNELFYKVFRRIMEEV